MLEITTQLHVNGSVSIVDLHDEGPLVELRFSAEANNLDEPARLRLGRLLQDALARELNLLPA
jgi:hypothetical protein